MSLQHLATSNLNPFHTGDHPPRGAMFLSRRDGETVTTSEPVRLDIVKEADFLSTYPESFQLVRHPFPRAYYQAARTADDLKKGMDYSFNEISLRKARRLLENCHQFAGSLYALTQPTTHMNGHLFSFQVPCMTEAQIETIIEIMKDFLEPEVQYFSEDNYEYSIEFFRHGVGKENLGIRLKQPQSFLEMNAPHRLKYMKLLTDLFVGIRMGLAEWPGALGNFYQDDKEPDTAHKFMLFGRDNWFHDSRMVLLTSDDPEVLQQRAAKMQGDRRWDSLYIIERP